MLLARPGFVLALLRYGVAATVLAIPLGSVAQETLEEVIVVAGGSQVTLPKAYEGGQVARGGRVGMFGNLDLMDTPFATTSYTQQLIRDQQSRSVADVLQNDPVVRVARGFGNFQELYVIRGFPAYSDDMTYNGIYGILPRQFIAAELLERVEVFRGANSFLNGAAPGGSGVGGAFNLVPKRAGSQPLTSVSVGIENAAQWSAALDVARRFGVNDRTGVRVNLVHRDGETSIDDQDRKLEVASVGADFRGEQLRLSADLGFQDHHVDAPRPSVTPLAGIPRPPDADRNFAQPWTYTDERQLFGVVRAEYDFSERLSAWVAAGGRHGDERNVLNNPSAQANGDTSAYRFDNAREDEIFSADAGVRLEFSTGPVGHRLVASASTSAETFKNAYAFSNFAGFSSNLYHSSGVAAPAADFYVGGVLSDPRTTDKTDHTSVALADMMAFIDGRVLVTIGARQQRIDTRSYDYNTGARLSGYDQSRLTPIGAVVFKSSEHLSWYANYVEGLIPGETAPTLSGGVPVTNAGEVFDPYRAQQYEVGTKFDAGVFGVTASVFQTTRPSSIIENGRFSVDGEQRHRGVELSVFGQPLTSLRVIGGLTVLDAELTRTQDHQSDGNEPIGVPDLQTNLNLEWDVLGFDHLTLDARMIYTAEQNADLANTQHIDAWTRLDLGARYQVPIGGHATTFRLRVDNATDKSYWASVGGYPGANYLVLGSPRTFAASASVEF